MPPSAARADARKRRDRKPERKKKIPAMASTNDIVLVYYEDNPIFFARIEDIQPDHKRDWYHVKLLVLQVPLQTATWILKDAYINGETFTMGGKRMRLETVEAPPEAAAAPEPGPEAGAGEEDPNASEKDKKTGRSGEATVIPLHLRKPEKK